MKPQTYQDGPYPNLHYLDQACFLCGARIAAASPFVKLRGRTVACLSHLIALLKGQGYFPYGTPNALELLDHIMEIEADKNFVA